MGETGAENLHLHYAAHWSQLWLYAEALQLNLIPNPASSTSLHQAGEIIVLRHTADNFEITLRIGKVQCTNLVK